MEVWQELGILQHPEQEPRTLPHAPLGGIGEGYFILDLTSSSAAAAEEEEQEMMDADSQQSNIGKRKSLSRGDFNDRAVLLNGPLIPWSWEYLPKHCLDGFLLPFRGYLHTERTEDGQEQAKYSRLELTPRIMVRTDRPVRYELADSDPELEEEKDIVRIDYKELERSSSE